MVRPGDRGIRGNHSLGLHAGAGERANGGEWNLFVIEEIGWQTVDADHHDMPVVRLSDRTDEQQA